MTTWQDWRHWEDKALAHIKTQAAVLSAAVGLCIAQDYLDDGSSWCSPQEQERRRTERDKAAMKVVMAVKRGKA